MNSQTNGKNLEQITEQDSWRVIESFFEENGLVSQQITSFNDFLQNTLQDIVNEVGNIKIFPNKQYKT